MSSPPTPSLSPAPEEDELDSGSEYHDEGSACSSDDNASYDEDDDAPIALKKGKKSKKLSKREHSFGSS